MAADESKLKRKAKVLVYLEPEEKDGLTARCEEVGVTMSTYLRMLLRRDLYYPQNPT